MYNISIVVDTFSLIKEKQEYCWRIVDNDKRNVLAFGFGSSMDESFKNAMKKYEEIEPLLKTNKDWMNKWKDFV